METDPPVEILQKALRKVLAAIEGSGFKAVAIGSMAHRSWGTPRAPSSVELLLPTGEAQREAIMGASRGEGLQQVNGAGAMSFRYNDAKLGASAGVELIEASTPFLKTVIARAQPRVVLQSQINTASCEDLILLRAVSELPADREVIIELLRATAAGMDAAYLKREAEAAGTFGRIKSAWAEAKQRG